MKKTFWGLFFKNLKELIREKKRNILLFSLPLAIFLFIFLFFKSSQVEKSFIQPINIGVIDNDNSLYSSALIEAYKGNKSFTDFINICIGRELQIKEAFADGKYDAIIEIPKDFADNLMRFEHSPVEVMVNYNDPIKGLLFKNVMESYENYITSVQVAVEVLYDKMVELSMTNKEISLYNNEISYELVMTSVGRNSFFKYNELVNIPSTTSVNYFFIAIIMMFLMYISIFTAIDLIREKELMCFKRLEVSRISIFKYLISKLLSSTFFIFIIVLIWFLIISITTNLNIHNNFGYIVLYIISCILLAVSFAMFFSSLFKKDESIILVSNIFIFMNAIIGGSIIPIHYMPNALRKIAVVTPNYWMIKGMLYLDSDYNRIYGIIFIGIFIVGSILLTYLSYLRYKKVG
jgi:ABC-2 type transport system permease protein